MKNTIKYLCGALLLAGTMVACSPEEFGGMDAMGVPEMSAFADQINIQVDQTTNQVTFTLNNAQAHYPYWEIELGLDKKGVMKYERSTVNGFQRIFATAGDYTVNCRVANRNGISVASVSKTFHIDNTIMDWGPYLKMLSKGPWYINDKEQGHMGCGPSGTPGLEWWSAAPGDKADWGVYDNSMTFTDSYEYTFDPGEAGSVYVNNGVSMWAEENILTGDDGAKIDFRHTVTEPQQTSYSLEVDGSDVYVVFPEHTYFPYIANDEIWNEPRYQILSYTGNSIEMRIDNGNIAWHYLLTNERVEKFKGFTYDQPDNIWKQLEVKAGGIYYADAGWAAYPDNGGATFEVSNEEVHIVLPLATASQWQAQFPIHTNVGPGSELVNSQKHYDFSCVVKSNKDLKGMTFKLVETGDNGVPGSLGVAYDANAVFYDNSTNLEANTDYVFYLLDQPGVDIQDNIMQLMLDFGGCEAGTEVTITNIVLIDHALNKELDKVNTNPDNGGDNPGQDKPQVDWDDASNLLAGGSFKVSTYYAHGGNWEGLPEYEHEYADGVHSLYLPTATDDRWQAQYTLSDWNIAIDPAKTYDFRLKVETSKDLPGMTVKLTQTDNDKVFLTEDVHVVPAGESWIELGDLGMKGDGSGNITNLKIVFDFGHNADDTEIILSNLHLQEHRGPKQVVWDDAANLWTTSGITIETYNAQGGDWHTPAAVLSYENNGDGSYYLNLPSSSDSQWQAQFKLLNTVKTSAGKKYDFRVILNPSKNVAQATVKWVLNGNDDVFYTDARHDLVADQDNVIVLAGADGIDMNALSLVLDFGGNEAETEVLISGIHVQESK